MKAILVNKQSQTADIVTYFFKPEQPMKWRAGQSVRLELPINSYDSEEKRFTISSAPYEELVSITTKISNSSFKQTLDNLEIGRAVSLSGIEGSFGWFATEKPHIMLAGGIGITPFYAMLKEKLHEAILTPTKLFYIGHEGKLAFLDELSAWQEAHPQFSIVVLDSTKPKITDVLAYGSNYYIAGPTEMVRFWQQQLSQAGVALYTIKTDLFSGY